MAFMTFHGVCVGFWRAKKQNVGGAGQLGVSCNEEKEASEGIMKKGENLGMMGFSR
jgi:hypothetical protein